MIELFGPLNTGVAAGGAGTATNNATSTVALSGVVRSIYVRYNDSPPAGTTDVTIATAGTNAPALTLLTLTDAATDGWFNVFHAIVSNAGGAIADNYMQPVIDDKVKVTIAQANNGDSADVWLLLED